MNPLKLAGKPRQSGNPAGRLLARGIGFGEKFICDALEVWEKHGKAALKIMAQEEPGDCVKAMVVALPKMWCTSG